MIVVFGSINLDIVVRVERLPGAGETVGGDHHMMVPGGKGANQAVAAQRAGCTTFMAGAVGQDAFRDPALSILKETGVDLSHIGSTDQPTGIAIISVDSEAQNAISVSSGANAQSKPPPKLLKSVPAGAILITQNEIPPDANREAWRLAGKAGMTIIHNAAPARPLTTGDLAAIDFLVMNEHECQTVASLFGDDVATPHKAARTVHEYTGTACILTLGDEGAVAFSADGEIAVAAPAIDAVDTTGAGDAFTGAFAAALHQGTELEGALRFGVTAGSLACQTLGAQTSSPSLAQIEAAMAEWFS